MSATAEQTNDQRCAQRVSAVLRIYSRGKKPFRDEVENISETGARVRSDRPLPVGTRSMFAVLVPKEDNPLEVAGTVVWSNGAAMGIRFEHINPRLKLWIDRWRENALS